MDLRTAVAVTLLPASRARVAAVFRELRDEAAGPALLEVVWSLARSPDSPQPPSFTGLFTAADEALAAAGRAGIEPIPVYDARYPPLLTCIADPPPVLWVRGQVEAFQVPAVAVIGSRAASPYAIEVATRIAGELAERNIAVVSGLARGVDSAAHRGCLQAGGITLAVLGSGVNRVYPPEHDELAGAVAERGIVLSELEPGVPPLPGHFPLRNRIISGLSLATLVVEASEHSGSLITARCALEQGRDVMAVPGNVLSGRNRGSHALLKDGARIVESADDVLEELGWPQPSAVVRKAIEQDPVLSRMEPGESYRLDDLSGRTGLPGPQLLSRLTELELAGRITAGSGRFSRRS